MIISVCHGNTKHGMSYTPIYGIWNAMVQRCYNLNHIRYEDYGGRGILVCARWHLFNNFYDDMGDRPEGLTLERINNDGNYEPGNCKWATRVEQQSNRRLQKPMSCGPNKQRWFIARNKKMTKYIKSNNQREFARQWELVRSRISDCLHREQRQHKGWTFVYI